MHCEGACLPHWGPAALGPEYVDVVADRRRHGGVAGVVGLEGRRVGGRGSAGAAASSSPTVVHAVDVAGLAAPYL